MTENTEPMEYPLGENPDSVETPAGVAMSEITLAALSNGDIEGEDIRITPETLERQAKIAETSNRPQVAENFRRAAELTRVPDERILEIYNALRPSGADKDQLLEIADELESEYDADVNAAHVREAAEMYEKRDLY